ncbi:hypothetical protein NON20_02185 [Synechocystis sp. B12]|nr:hypothetical protein NON20_02185 [Synechocystis sp. B12]
MSLTQISDCFPSKVAIGKNKETGIEKNKIRPKANRKKDVKAPSKVIYENHKNELTPRSWVMVTACSSKIRTKSLHTSVMINPYFYCFPKAVIIEILFHHGNLMIVNKITKARVQ